MRMGPMMRRGPFAGVALGVVAGLGLAAGGCADQLEDDTGTLVVGLRDDTGGWFRLRIFSSQPNAALEGDEIYGTGCLEAKSRTYELTRIPSGTDRWVVIESFQSATCDAAVRQEMGFRGGVEIPRGGTAPYFHVPLYDEHGLTALPEDINISASLAEPIDTCLTDAHCEAEFGAGYACFDEQKPSYWCLPSCDANADCAGYHPDATCDLPTGYCILRSPFPLNLSEPRALGHAVDLSDGSVAFLGGYGLVSAGRLQAGQHAVEVFDATLGLFTRPEIAGLDALPGLSGLARLSSDRVALVGGAGSLTLNWSGSGSGLTLEGAAPTGGTCPGATCVGELSDALVVVDFASGQATTQTLPTAIAMPAVAVLDDGRLLVMGGLVEGDEGVQPTDATWLCSVGGDCEPGPTLSTPRAGATVACLGEACAERVLVGGNTTGKLAEAIEVDGDEVAFATLLEADLPARVFGAQTCGATLVAGAATPTGVGGVTPARLAREGSDLNGTAVPTDAIEALPLWPAVAAMPGGGCWIFGGLDGDGRVSATTFRATPANLPATTFDMSRGRFGAMAAPIGAGPLTGSVVVGGGLRLIDGNGVGFVRGAEVLRP